MRSRLVVLGLVLVGCPARQGVRGPAVDAAQPVAVVEPVEEVPPAFAVVLSEVQPAPERVASAAVSLLGAREVDALLARLPAMPAGPAPERPFVLRAATRPPPAGAQRLPELEPAKTHPARAQVAVQGPLRVLQHSPTGESGVVRSISITFSQPMVAPGTYEAAGAATLSPAAAGEWSWVDATTLEFRADERLAMATTYTVTLAPGLASPGGAKLAKGTGSFQFSTSPARLIRTETVRSARLLMFLGFDQRIDPAAVLPKLRLRDGAAALRVERVPAAEARKDGRIAAAIADAAPGTWMVVRPATALPGGRRIVIEAVAGVPSAEGPRVTTKEQQDAFFSATPLELRDVACTLCELDGWFELRFSNRLDADTVARAIRVEPPLPDMRVESDLHAVRIFGRRKARSRYKITIDGSIADVHGQTLGTSVTRTVEVGALFKFAGGRRFAVLDPAAKGRFSIVSTGLASFDVRVHAVTPADLQHVLTREAPDPYVPGSAWPGKHVFTQTVKVADIDEPHTATVDLGPALRGGHGFALVITERTDADGRGRWPTVSWVQATDIGLDTFVDATKMQVFASRLTDGKPLAGVQVQLMPGGAMARTDADGLAQLMLGEGEPFMLHAQLGDDLAFMLAEPNGRSWRGRDRRGRRQRTAWQAAPEPALLHWYVFDDRRLYRPGETVRVKGWLRREAGGPRGGLHLPGATTRIQWTLRDEQDNLVKSGMRTIGAHGGFDLAIPLPRDVNLGTATLALEVPSGAVADEGGEYTHELEIQEFRRPEFEVAARSEGSPEVGGTSVGLAVAANYFAGGPLVGAEARWQVSASDTTYTPPGHDDYTFGDDVDWFVPRRLRWRDRGTYSARADAELAGRTDGAGEHHVRVALQHAPSQPVVVRGDVSVTDVNRQEWTAEVETLVHPGGVYVGLRRDRLFVARGGMFAVEAIAVDPDGTVVPGRPIAVQARRLGSPWDDAASEGKPQDCSATSAAEPVRCDFRGGEAGVYRISATVRDAQDRESQSSLAMWVAGGPARPLQPRSDEDSVVTVIEEKSDYAPGDTAKLLVVAPFAGEGVVTVRRGGLVETRRVTIAAEGTTIDLPIAAHHVPGIRVQVDVVGSTERPGADGSPDRSPDRSLPRVPARATGETWLGVPARDRRLDLALEPGARVLEPGASTDLTITMRDAQGEPVAGGEVAVVVVDEAVLALAGVGADDEALEDPLDAMFVAREDRVHARHSRDDVAFLDLSGEPTSAMTAQAGEKARARSVGDGESGRGPPVEPALRLRKRFDALALFAATLPTDAKGRARAKIRLPDNLTRYRVMAAAAAGTDRFGVAETTITARLPLTVRPSPPRFLHDGDKFELPVLVHNQTDAPLTVDLAARTANLDLVQGAGRRVQVPARERVEVRLPAAAGQPGLARFQIAAVSGRWSDAVAGELPVRAPAMSAALAVYGQIDGAPVVQRITPPAGALPQYGGLEVTTASTAMTELTDAALYLARYPYECNEQIASRLLALVALKDVLAAFKTPGLPTRAELGAFLAPDLARLAGMQNHDGGWDFWSQSGRSWPFLSVHVTHALFAAQQAGFAVPEDVLAAAWRYVEDIDDRFVAEYRPRTRLPIRAYALNLRHQRGDRDAVAARAVLGEVPLADHSLETLGWLLPVLKDSNESAEILRHLVGAVRETAGAAHFVDRADQRGDLYLASDGRVDGVLLDALVDAAPRSDLVPRLARGRLAQRSAGQWVNTQENAFNLLALRRYFAAYERTTPDFVARAWLGDKAAGEHAFTGRTNEQHRVFVPMQALLAEGAKDLVLAKTGPGRLYYRIGLRHVAAADLVAADPVDRGFAVTRAYAGVDDRADVRRDADGTWRIRAGARVRVDLILGNDAERYHVALVDPLPAGLEALSPALDRRGEVDAANGRRWGWRWWYDHDNLRDDRAEAFTASLHKGVHAYSYMARATTPGTFTAPATRAEEMYAPEIHGRAATDRVIVE